jgi:hypothetical protein
LAAVEQNPSKFMEATKVLKSEEDLKALVNAFAFGKDKWEKYFGPIGDVPALPNNIVEILCSDDPFNVGKKVAETHMLVLVPTTAKGEKLTLRSLTVRVKAPLAGHKSDYRYYSDTVDREHGAKSLQCPQWVLMTRDVIPGSSSKSYADQKGMMAGKPHYEVPDLLPASVVILTHYVRTGERLFSDNPNTYTRCKEVAGEFQTIVGGFAPAGLTLNYYYIHSHNNNNYGHEHVGVAAQWKF